MNLLHILLKILWDSFSMFWEVLWPLALGFSLSAIIQAVVSHKSMAKTLGNDSLQCFTLSSLFGITSSSCSYAAVALSRSLFKKGATFTNAMIFELASTNLVFELGLILFVLMGWQFLLAQWIGGIVMVILLALLFRVTLTKKLVDAAKQQAGVGLSGKMEGHAAMDMSISGEKPFWQKLFSKDGFTAISHFFIMDVASVWIDILLGFLIAGAFAVLIPAPFWKVFFFTNDPGLRFIIGPLVGPLIAIISFVCSVGNVPLAAVLWQGGISFGGVVSFIFADLLVLPILDIYRKYYGWKTMAYITVTFYVTMALAGYIVELLFTLLHIIPTQRSVAIISHGLSLNFTSVLNILFLLLGGALLYRFLKTGGMSMLRMMDTPEHALYHGNHHKHSNYEDFRE